MKKLRNKRPFNPTDYGKIYESKQGNASILVFRIRDMGAQKYYIIIHKNMGFGKFGGRTSKFGAKKTEIDGITFASALEARFYEFLRDDPRVEILELQPKYPLQPKYTNNKGEKIRCIDYVSDFLIAVNGKAFVVDSKGMQTADFKLKKKIFEYLYPNENLVVVKSLKDLRVEIF